MIKTTKNILLFSSLFPSTTKPVKGIFVSELASALSHKVKIAVFRPVIAPMDFKEVVSGKRHYFWKGLEVYSPVCINIPKFFKKTDGYFMGLSVKKPFNQLIEKQMEVDLIHAHFAYPDGAAAAMLAREKKIPFIVTVHGSDINIHTQDPGRRELIIQTVKDADRIICVSKELKKRVTHLGIDMNKVHHIPNGVDIHKFFSGNRKQEKNTIGLPHAQKLILTVGNLVPIKAFDRLITAMAAIDPSVHLVMVGSGPLEKKLQQLAIMKGVGDRVHFHGIVEHEKLPAYYRAADFLVVCSHSEGWPTVIFESFACGTPVLANTVGGIPEIFHSNPFGILMENNAIDTIAAAVDTAFNQKWDDKILINEAIKHSWDNIARRTIEIYDSVLSSPS